jgi:cytochrome P450
MSQIVEIPTSRVQNFFAFQHDPLGFLVHAVPMGPVVSLKSGAFRPSYIVNDPSFIQEILVTKEASFRKGRAANVLRRTIGDGLLTSEADRHRLQKQVIVPAFYKERIQAYALIVAEETAKLADRFEDGQIAAVHEEMMQLTLAIITRSMFNTDVSEEFKQILAAAVTETIEQSARTIFSPVILPFALPTRGHAKHKRAIQTLESLLYDVIREARRNPKAYELSLAGLLLDTKYADDSPVTDEDVRDQMMTMLLAGHETTANALAWCWYELGRHPEIERHVEKEVGTIRLQEEDAFDTYRKFTYSQQVIQEVLRLYPPAWVILRETHEDVVLQGELFRRNSSFMISPYALHRNADVFEDPYAFRPERFAKGAGYPRFQYFPFGGGSRGCIGSQFAMMESVLILAGLVQRITFVPDSPKPAVPEPLISLRIQDGLHMRVLRKA